MKYCPRCGYPNPDDAKFCIRCGYQFPEMIQLNQPPQSQPPSPYYSQPPSHDQPPKKNIPIIPLIALVSLIVVVLVVVAVVLPGITGSGAKGTTLAFAADQAFGGNWKIDKSASLTATISGNSATVTFLNGTTETVSNSSEQIGQVSQLVQYGIKKLSIYTLVNGTSNISLGVIYNFNSTSNPELIFVIGLIEAFSHKYNFSGGVFYLSNSSGYDEVFLQYNGNFYIIDFHGFTPTVQQIATFLDRAIT